MMKLSFPLFSCLASLLVAGASGAQTTAPQPAAPEAQLDEVLVTGEQPGPGMWRVSKGDHDLWILATLEPLPKDLTWRSTAVDAHIAQSQVILAPPDVDVDVGFFRGLTLLPSLLRARKNPDGQTLEQILPHESYMRWLALKVKYLGHWSGDEHLRPLVAAYELFSHAVDAAGLSSDARIWDSIKQSAHKHGVPIQTVTLKLPLDDPKGAIKDLGQIPQEAELACLDTTMTRLENDLQSMRRRANLWSRGDIEGLRALPFADQDVACFDAVSSAPGLHDRIQRVKDQVSALWLASATAALEKNASSFAVLPIEAVLRPDGLVEQLRAKGYTVEAP